MQIDKYYQAQDIRKNILEAEALMQRLTSCNGKLLNPEIISELNTDLRAMLADKANDVVKKELGKIIKQLEKDFLNL